MREPGGFATTTAGALTRQERLASLAARHIRVLYLGLIPFRSLKITWFDLRIEPSVPDQLSLLEAQKPLHTQLESILFYFNSMSEEFHLHFRDRPENLLSLI